MDVVEMVKENCERIYEDLRDSAVGVLRALQHFDNARTTSFDPDKGKYVDEFDGEEWNKMHALLNASQRGILEAGYLRALTEQEKKDVMAWHDTLQDNLNRGQFETFRAGLKSLTYDTFRFMIDKVVECECGK